MLSIQPGILAACPQQARYLTFTLVPGADPGSGLWRLTETVDPASTVTGIGRSTLLALGREIDGLRDFPSRSGPSLEIPATPAALWLWLRGDDRGELLHRTRSLAAALAGEFALAEVVDAFQHADGRDLTGYEDGTENPKGDAAPAAAAVAGRGAGLDGSSFVAVQRWVHDLDRFQSMSPREQDESVGRRRSDNAELADAPPSAHVKRTAQESFEPAAFVLRRSMPWADAREAGLVFVAFGHSLDAFEALLARMVGSEDGIVDSLFRYTRPVSGACFWCPPVRGGRLDLGAIGL